jgi:hypothetical protein
MSEDQKKQYTVEFDAGEAEKIESGAVSQGVSTTDFIVYCARQVCFGINYAITRLADAGQIGPFDKD